MPERLAIFYVFAELWLSVLGGPYKWILVLGHTEALNTLQDVYAFAVVLGSVAAWIIGGERASTKVILLQLLLFLCLLNGIVQNGFVPAVIGYKVILAIQVAFVASRRMADRHWLERFGRHLKIACVVTVAGILIDRFIDFPWHGLTYENFGFGNQVSRRWWAGGHERIAGFTVSSASAAALVLYGSWAFSLHARGHLIRSLIAALGFGAIWLTTTKTTIVLVPLFMIFSMMAGEARSRTVGLFGRACILLSAGLLGMSFLKAGVGSTGNDEFGIGGSFVQRMEQTWPQALASISGIQAIFGAGVGSAGLPNRLLSSDYRGSLDNLLLWTLLNFGLAGTAVIVGLLQRRIHLARELILYEGLGAMLIAGGLTQTMVENRFAAVLLGLYLGLAVHAGSIGAARDAGSALDRPRLWRRRLPAAAVR